MNISTKVVLLVGLAACTPAQTAPSPAAPLPPMQGEQANTRAFEPPTEKPAAEPTTEGEGTLGTAPGGTLVRSDAAKVDVSSFYAEGGAVVVFYRGHWCKPCRAQLAELQTNIDRFMGQGFKVYAISVDAPSDSAELKQTLGLGFDLYSDTSGLAANAWSVYSAEHGLARPAVFVVRKGGVIAAKFVTETPTHRPPMEELLAAVERASAAN